MKAVGKAAKDCGVELTVDWGGKVPSPAGAYRGRTKKSVAVIVTGSHIPFDMNGIKYYLEDGEEVLKENEKDILSQVFGAFFNASRLLETGAGGRDHPA